MAKGIEDYALIGDCESAALVGRDGSIDWLCWPRFDSGAVFSALLGDAGNGHWSLTAASNIVSTSRKYRGNTLILETLIKTENGAATVIDFMPIRDGGGSHVVRLVEGKRGHVEMETELVLRFDYGLIVPWITRVDGNGLQAAAGPDKVVLRTAVPLKAEGFRHRARFKIGAGERVSFVLSYCASFLPNPEPIDPLRALEKTGQFWDVIQQDFNLAGTPYADMVLRSLITLKALTYPLTGGVVAAPTTSLPEKIGGARNWDYRYCWLRDATFTLLALLNSGFRREARAFRLWLQRAVGGCPEQMQIVYGLGGERRLIEYEIPWLSGFRNSKPVRTGNAAYNQLQIDVYGELMDALFHSSLGGLDPGHEAWPLQRLLLDHLEEIWQMPDNGFWEVRTRARHFTHSKVMAWVAFDRAIGLAERFHLEGPIDRWRRIKKQIHQQVCKDGYDAKQQAFVQSYGSNELDAGTLLFSLIGFLPPDDPRIRSTVEAIGNNLCEGRLIKRYRTNSGADGVGGGEGVFLACSFWYADNLILLGREREARDLFEYLLTLCNDVGLLSEEYDPHSGRMLGNFPQAFSHVALVNTAHNLAAARKPLQQRSNAGYAGAL